MHDLSRESDAVHAGQAVYTPLTLAVYDWLVLGLSNRLIWRCPTPGLLRLYNEQVTADHLDVGVGTGYFLDRCRFPVATPRIHLLDLNPNALRAAARRVRRYQPHVHQANVLEPIDLEAGEFVSSIGLNYVLHCLPGTIASKAVVFDHLLPLLRPGGVLFGSTILSRGVRHTRAARRLMALYNRKGIFSNEADDLEGLEQALTQRFSRHRLECRGSVAIFSAWR